jgi:ketosteroid isomerase-like protein
MHAPFLRSSADETEAAFYDALSRSDIDALMALWAEDEEVVCIHPGSTRLVGHALIRASFEAIFERGTVNIRPVQLHVTRNMMTAIHSIIEEVRRSPRNAEMAPDVHILCTNVYIKTPRGWQMTLHHASVAPGPAPSELLRASMLH